MKRARRGICFSSTPGPHTDKHMHSDTPSWLEEAMGVRLRWGAQLPQNGLDGRGEKSGQGGQTGEPLTYAGQFWQQRQRREMLCVRADGILLNRKRREGQSLNGRLVCLGCSSIVLGFFFPPVSSTEKCSQYFYRGRRMCAEGFRFVFKLKSISKRHGWHWTKALLNSKVKMVDMKWWFVRCVCSWTGWMDEPVSDKQGNMCVFGLCVTQQKIW